MVLPLLFHGFFEPLLFRLAGGFGVPAEAMITGVEQRIQPQGGQEHRLFPPADVEDKRAARAIRPLGTSSRSMVACRP